MARVVKDVTDVTARAVMTQRSDQQVALNQKSELQRRLAPVGPNAVLEVKVAREVKVGPAPNADLAVTVRRVALELLAPDAQSVRAGPSLPR